MSSNMHVYEYEEFNQIEYKKIRGNLKKNDVLVIKSLSSLGNNQPQIQKELIHITKKIKADLVVLDIPLLDTRINKEINGTLIPDLVIEMLSYSSKVEKKCRKQLQIEGIANAQASGVKFGRPAEPFPKGFNKIYKKVISKEITKTDGAKELGITFHKMSRLVDRKTKEKENKNKLKNDTDNTKNNTKK